jgi:nucleoside-diphosphate-sugar epimerase
MRVVVTGGSGRLGQYVVRELFTHAHAVSSLDRVKPRECLCPTYSFDLTRVESLFDHFKDADAVVHLARVRFPYTETGFNQTTQRWEFPDAAGDAEKFNQNIALTNNVLTAAQATGLTKIVCASSLAVYGMYYPTTSLLPAYLPVDEEHPRHPQDPYGLTKLVGETLCDPVSRRSGIQIASLRFSGIYTETHRPMLLARKKDPLIRGTGSLWSYIDARDAARACRLALETNFKGHEAFNVCAPATMMDTPTADLAHRHLPQVKEIRAAQGEHWSGYSANKAANLLGFTAKIMLDTP